MIFQVRITSSPQNIMEIRYINHQITTKAQLNKSHFTQLPPTIWLSYKLKPWCYGITSSRYEYPREAQGPAYSSGKGGNKAWKNSYIHSRCRPRISPAQHIRPWSVSIGCWAPVYTCDVEGIYAFMSMYIWAYGYFINTYINTRYV